MPIATSFVQPTLWQSVPFGDRNALLDFLGQHALWHAALDHRLRLAGAAPYPSLPLGDGPLDDGADWHLVHQLIHDGEAAGLALSEAPDFTAYDLTERDQFASWTWSHGAEHSRLALAGGL